jgi:hypothetical protein
MKSFYTNQEHTAIAVIDSDEEGCNILYLPESGNPESLGDHVDPVLKSAAQNPQSEEEYFAYLEEQKAAHTSVELTSVQKLAAAGLSVDELKSLLDL